MLCFDNNEITVQNMQLLQQACVTLTICYEQTINVEDLQKYKCNQSLAVRSGFTARTFNHTDFTLNDKFMEQS